MLSFRAGALEPSRCTRQLCVLSGLAPIMNMTLPSPCRTTVPVPQTLERWTLIFLGGRFLTNKTAECRNLLEVLPGKGRRCGFHQMA
uniref:Uncharacterized protein n=1 Tax=Arundo donax TaxID=35708 RepID=A0A0A9B330_ARUDO